MFKRFLMISLSVVGLTFAGVATLSPATVSAASPQSEVCKGIGAASGSGGCSSNISLTRVIRNVINLFSIVIGIIAVIMVMFSGFKYVTAAGDSGSLTTAKQTLIYAIVGLVIAALAQVIVQFVLRAVR